MLTPDVCFEAVATFGGLVAMWLRFERRLTKIEGRVIERYRDKKATEERIARVEKWLPPGTHQP